MTGTFQIKPLIYKRVVESSRISTTSVVHESLTRKPDNKNGLRYLHLNLNLSLTPNLLHYLPY
ncbi:hypothetical protein CsatA_016702 [Cannabis sativa]